MKKIVLMSLFVCLSAAMHAQFTDYTPVIIDESRSSGNHSMGYPNLNIPRQRTQQQENLQTITAYYVNSRGAFQKIRLKVSVTAGTVGEQITVKAYYNSTYNMWSSTSARATEITSYGPEPDVIKENFDYKCYILNIGNVYF